MNRQSVVAGLTVNEMIRLYPRSVEVFNRYGIDACCGGAVPVAQAATRDGAKADAIIAELRQIIRDDA